MSKYKPGQLVTIDHTVYRIRSGGEACRLCAFRGPIQSVCIGCERKLGMNGYYEKVCGKQDN